MSGRLGRGMGLRVWMVDRYIDACSTSMCSMSMAHPTTFLCIPKLL